MQYVRDPYSPAAVLGPECFLQGSYDQDTAIHSINDVDIVALCSLVQPGSGSGRSYSRDEIYNLIAASLAKNPTYGGELRTVG